MIENINKLIDDMCVVYKQAAVNYQKLNKFRKTIKEIEPVYFAEIRQKLKNKYVQCFDDEGNITNPKLEQQIYGMEKIVLRELFKYRPHKFLKDEYHNFCEMCGLQKENPIHS